MVIGIRWKRSFWPDLFWVVIWNGGMHRCFTELVFQASVAKISHVFLVMPDLTCCALIAQCTTGVQPHPFPEFNQTDSGQGRLIKLAIIPTHTTGAFTCLLKGCSLLAGKLAGKSDRWSLSKICVLCWSNLEKWTIDGRSMGLLLCKCFAETELMLGLWRCILLYKKTVEHSPINLCMLLWIKSSEKQC